MPHSSRDLRPVGSALRSLMFGLACALAGSLCFAQGTRPSDQVLSGKNVTEDAITKGLSEDGTRSRSPRVGMRPGQSARSGDEPSPAGAKTGGAVSLLITFETNATDISASSIPALDKLGRALKSEALASASFDVEGHADPRGSAEDNLKLSQGRAESVVAYLVSKHGIEASRLRAIGKGDREPLNAQVPAAPENRRVTIRKQSS